MTTANFWLDEELVLRCDGLRIGREGARIWQLDVWYWDDRTEGGVWLGYNDPEGIGWTQFLYVMWNYRKGEEDARSLLVAIQAVPPGAFDHEAWQMESLL